MLRVARAAGFAAVVVVTLASLIVPAHANAVIDFSDGATSGGTITLLSDGNLTGSSIPITLMKAFDTSPSGSFGVTGGLPSSTGLLSFSTGGAGGPTFITITGGIPGLGVSSTTLVSGTISSFDMSNVALGLVSAKGLDTKSPTLLTALGLAPDTPFAFFAFSLGLGGALTPGGPGVIAISTDFENIAVPEPATLLLVASGGLAGLATWRRRRQVGSPS